MCKESDQWKTGTVAPGMSHDRSGVDLSWLIEHALCDRGAVWIWTFGFPGFDGGWLWQLHVNGAWL